MCETSRPSPQAARAHDIMALCNHGGAIYPGSHNALNFPPMLYAELLPFLGALSQVGAGAGGLPLGS